MHNEGKRKEFILDLIRMNSIHHRCTTYFDCGIHHHLLNPKKSTGSKMNQCFLVG